MRTGLASARQERRRCANSFLRTFLNAKNRVACLCGESESPGER